MIRQLTLFSCVALTLSLTGCPSNGEGSGAGGTGGGTGGGCEATPGACGASFKAPDAGTPSSDCKDERELAGIPDGTTLKKACSPYHVKDVATAQGHLTIEAGVHIQLADDAQFNVSDNEPTNPRSLHAEGTACDPIVFEPDSANGRFGHVNIGSTAPGDDKGNSVLRYVEFRGGASKPATLDASDAIVFLTGAAPVLLDHVNFLDSKHFGLGLGGTALVDPASSDLFFDDTADGPIFFNKAESLETFPTIAVGCKPGAGNLVENGIVFRTMTWATQPIPFLFRNTDLGVSPTAQPTVLTISAPNTFLFGSTDAVKVGGNEGVPANLVAQGDITFDAIDPQVGWHGFYIVTSADHGTVISGGKIAHGGTVEAFGTSDSKKAFASVIVNISNQSWPDISNETIEHPNAADPGDTNERACIYVGAQVAGSEPKYEENGNVFTDCGVNVAHSD